MCFFFTDETADRIFHKTFPSIKALRLFMFRVDGYYFFQPLCAKSGYTAYKYIDMNHSCQKLTNYTCVTMLYIDIQENILYILTVIFA